MSEFLYGTPGAELMDSDLFDAVERAFDDGDDGPYTIEEWTTRGFDSVIMAADRIIEDVIEHAADDLGFEQAFDALQRAGEHPETVEAFETARTTLIRKVKGWRFAEDLVRTATVYRLYGEYVAVWKPVKR